MKWLVMHTYEDGPKVRRCPNTGMVLNPTKGRGRVTRKDFKRTTQGFSRRLTVDRNGAVV